VLLHRIWDPKLAQAGYLIGCTEAGAALVIDATRDVDLSWSSPPASSPATRSPSDRW
jgi:hypothetical protein